MLLDYHLQYGVSLPLRIKANPQRSLSPECTPLKQRYDSCFNAWFEGYLQPALDSSSRRPAVLDPSPSAETSSEASSASSSCPDPTARIATSWAHAFRSKRTVDIPLERVTPGPPSPDYFIRPTQTTLQPVVDVKGKTRAQIKAEEYERNCGQVWKEYHKCLTVRVFAHDKS
jgi:hypothetical protein